MLKLQLCDSNSYRDRVVLSFSKQLFPPNSGTIREQFRDLVLFTSPHVPIQSVHSVHSAHCPSTKIRNEGFYLIEMNHY